MNDPQVRVLKNGALSELLNGFFYERDKNCAFGKWLLIRSIFASYTEPTGFHEFYLAQQIH